MLDLTQFKHKTFDVRLPDGQKVKLKKPTQRFALGLAAIANTDAKKLDATKLKEIFDNVNSLAVEILNYNEAGLVFSEQYVEENFNLDMCLALIYGYINFTTELTSEKN